MQTDPLRAAGPCAGWGTGERYAALAAETVTWALLGKDGEGPLFAADVSEVESGRLADFASDGSFVDLRRVGALVSARDAADPRELEDARWFSAAQVAEFGEGDNEAAEFRLPGKDSIARLLLDDRLADQRP